MQQSKEVRGGARQGGEGEEFGWQGQARENLQQTGGRESKRQEENKTVETIESVTETFAAFLSPFFPGASILPSPPSKRKSRKCMGSSHNSASALALLSLGLIFCIVILLSLTLSASNGGTLQSQSSLSPPTAFSVFHLSANGLLFSSGSSCRDTCDCPRFTCG
eukprot:749009-Hanusia_phi.AAC.1